MKKRVICPNCGFETEVDAFSVEAICDACGSRFFVEHKEEKAELSDFEKKKILLEKAYLSREISDIMLRSKDIVEIYPNDPFANFLYAYCLLRKGNNHAMLDFLMHADPRNASEKEIDSILFELTKSHNYYDEKCLPDRRRGHPRLGRNNE